MAQLSFREFRVDLTNEQLWHGNEEYSLPPRVFALLRYLIERPNQLVTREELLTALWSGAVIEEAGLTVALGALRKALGDDPRAPRFIKTVHRRGYCFVAPITPILVPATETPVTNVQMAVSETVVPRRPKDAAFVGRAGELEQLQRAWEQACRGERQLIFVTGEPGIGKTTVVNTFLQGLATESHFLCCQGQCIEHYGSSEAYLPVLEALGQLCRGTARSRLLPLLRQYAPTWLMQMPALLAEPEAQALQHQLVGFTRERMLREMAEALEALTGDYPHVVVLEDLHWSDVSTVDLLSYLARRRQPAQLLVLGTYRPVDLIVREHPLKAVKQDLQERGQCQEVALGVLRQREIEDYLAQQFPGHHFPTPLARLLHQRTEGNPLFLTTLLQDWVRHGIIATTHGQWTLHAELDMVAHQIPTSLRRMVEQRLACIPSSARFLLEVASIAGEEFSAALVAVGGTDSVVDVEDQCEGLVQRDSMLEARGIAEWPDGTVASSYGFTHALYREVLLAHVPAARRVQLHRHIGARLEAAYAGQTEAIATELAVHYEQGRDYAKAIRYLEQAAQLALQHSAHFEVIALITKGLKLLETLPESAERWGQELAYQTILATAFRVVKGYSADETVQVLLRAEELCHQLGVIPQLGIVQLGLIGAYIVRADYQRAHTLAAQLLRATEGEPASPLLLPLHTVMGFTLLQRGELVSSWTQFKQGIALYNLQSHSALAAVFGQDFGVSCLIYGAWALWLLGYPDHSLQRSQEAFTLAQKLDHSYSKALVLSITAYIHKFRGDELAALEKSEKAIELSRAQGFPLWLAIGTAIQGWVRSREGQPENGLVQLQQSLVNNQTAGVKQGQSLHLSWIAEACGYAGQFQQGLRKLDEARRLANLTGECLGEAELHRLTGEFLLKLAGRKLTPKSLQEVEVYFAKAIEIAHQQEAKSWELRATTSLARLWQHQGKKDKARQMLSELYGWFTEGFDTKDLQEAKALLEGVSRTLD